jgi:hypothetical protein
LRSLRVYPLNKHNGDTSISICDCRLQKAGADLQDDEGLDFLRIGESLEQQPAKLACRRNPMLPEKTASLHLFELPEAAQWIQRFTTRIV